MTRVVVEVAFGTTLADAVATGGTWTDITGRTEIQSSGISITRGAQDELADIQVGTCTLTLDNSDGALTPENSGSPYYPHVIDGVPLRVGVVTATTNLVLNPSFEGGSLEYWEWSTGVAVTAVGGSVQVGTRAARVAWSPSASDVFRTTVYGLTIGATHTASAYVYVPSGDAAVRLRMGGATSSASAVTDAYTRLSVSFTATASVMTLEVIPASAPAAGDLVLVDAVQVEEGASATAYSALDAARLHWRFWGLVTQWPVVWAGLGATATVTAVDVLGVLSRAEDQMRPMLVHEILADSPAACYPMDEPGDSTSAGDSSGTVGPESLAVQQNGTGGALEFGTGTAPLGMAGAPLVTPASSANGKYLRASLGAAAQAASLTQALLVEAWFSTSTAGRNILTIASSDSGYYLILYLASATGFLTVESKQPGVAAVTTTAGATNLADGQLHHVLYDAETKTLFVDGIGVGSYAGILAVQDLSVLTVGASHTGANIWSGSISNVAVYFDTSLSGTSLATAHHTAGTTGFAGETAEERALRLVGYTGLGFGDLGTFSTGIAEQAALGRTALEHLRDVERTESGKLYASRDAASVILQGRSVRYNPSSVLTIAYVDFEPGDFELAYDTQKVANVLVLTRPGGATQRMVNAASRAARGPMGRTLDTLATTDLVVTDLGNWHLERYAAPRVELRGIRIEASTMGLSTYRTLLDADISTVFTVTDMPAQAPSSSMSVMVEGYREDIRHNQHSLQFHTSRADTDTVWVLNSASYSVLGSTTRLAY
ncbi:LamG-like jellyroll fold domain-containing protein [Streptomyces glaucescens]|uniref:LamG-like jellyroll fold domain-containing protein n=1 Tax=Streptomyces glaucescens TaxID=1907 RepID=UPI00344EA3D0